MRINDVGIVTKDQLEVLAKLAPKEETGAAPAMDQGKKRRPGASGKPDFGRVLVDKYLTHYGIPFNIKQPTAADPRTFYRFNQCWFNPAHGKNESAIVQDPSGKLAYWCFHNTCNHTWREVKQLISGTGSLNPFRENYDPAKHEKIKTQLGSPAKPFLILDERKKRPAFNPALMAEYLLEEYAPVVCEGRDFGNSMFRYNTERGVWEPLPEAEILHVTCRDLDEFADPGKMEKVLRIFQSKIYRHPDTLKSPPMMLNLRNGMLDLATMEVKKHDPDYNSRVQMPVSYDEKAQCPEWLAALGQIFVDDDQKIEVLQQFFGYCLYPKIIFPAAMFQIGSGSNGKGTVERVLSAILGGDNVSNISLKRMEKQFGPIELRDKLLNACGETASEALETTHFKQIAAGDTVQAEVKYTRDVKFVPIAKHLISMNEFPGIKDKTDAFFRRIIVMEYKQRFEDQEADKRLADRIISTELNGVFLWALEGLKEVLKNEEIIVPESVTMAKKRFRQRVNPVLVFVEECCELGEFDRRGEENRALPPDMWKVYGQWCEDGNVNRLGKQRFYDQLLSNFKITKARRGSKEYFLGIGIRPELPFVFSDPDTL